MVLTGELPQVDADAPDPLRRRRWPWVVVGIAVVATMAFAAYWYWPVLTPDNSNWLSSQSGMVRDGVLVRSIDNTFGTEWRLSRPETGDVVTINASVDPTVAGRPVTVESIGAPFFDGSGGMAQFITGYHVVARPGVDGAPWTSLSTAMATYDARYAATHIGLQLRLQFTIPDCRRDNGGGTSTTSVPLTYRYHGVSRTVTFDLGAAYSLWYSPVCMPSS